MKYIVHINLKREAAKDNPTDAIIYITRTLDKRYGEAAWQYQQFEDRGGQFVWNEAQSAGTKMVAAYIEAISDRNFEDFVKELLP